VSVVSRSSACVGAIMVDTVVPSSHRLGGQQQEYLGRGRIIYHRNWSLRLLVSVSRSCPVCKEQLWTDVAMMDPLFYRNRMARRYYADHVNHKHPEFAKWDKKIQAFYGIVVLVVSVSSLLYLPAVLTPAGLLPNGDTPFLGALFVSAVVLTAVFVFVVQRGRKRFRELWNKEHGTQ
jgi:hypothetical protein